MEAQRKLVHMLERKVRQPPHRVHRDIGENAVAHLREQRHQDAHAAIGDRHHDRRRDRPGEPVARRDRRRAVAGQRIGRPFEGERHRDGGELGGEQQHRRDQHAVLEIAPFRRPDVGPELDQRREERTAIAGHLTLHGVARSLIHVAHWQSGPRRAKPAVVPPSYKGFSAAAHPAPQHGGLHSAAGDATSTL